MTNTRYSLVVFAAKFICFFFFFFKLGKDKAVKERDGLCLLSAVPKIQWALTPLPLWLLGYGKPLPLSYLERKSVIPQVLQCQINVVKMGYLVLMFLF